MPIGTHPVSPHVLQAEVIIAHVLCELQLTTKLGILLYAKILLPL
jgi:hypothetical protein